MPQTAPAPRPAPPDSPLFRPEAVAEQQERWLGRVLLVPRPTQSLIVAGALLAAAGVAALLAFGEYTRKARIRGWLVPELGLIRVVPPQAGLVTQLHVREGQAVRRGDPLLLVSTEVQSESLGATRSEVVQRLRERRDSMRQDRDPRQRLHAAEAQALAARLAALAEQQRQADRDITLQRARLALAEEGVARDQALRAQALGTAGRLQRSEEERLDQALRLQELERYRAGLETETMRLEATRLELPLRHALQLAEIDRSIGELEQAIVEAEARRETLITAPQDGTIAAMQVEVGAGAVPTVPLLSIVPAGSGLQAQLFSPSEAIGFVRPGQTVRLRYAAFPYQKFGHHAGVVASVSRSAISPSDLPQQVAGLVGLHGGTEPVYRIAVTPERQTVLAYGEPLPLQPGMQLEADVLIETRRLFEWVLDPLFSIGGRWWE